MIGGDLSKMKTTYKQIRNAEEAMGKILALPMDAKLSYRLTKITKRLLAESKHIEESRIELVEKFGVATVDGRINVPPAKNKEFQKAFSDFLESDVELDNIQPIPFSMVVGQKIPLSAIDLVNLEGFVTEPTEEELKDVVVKKDTAEASAK